MGVWTEAPWAGLYPLGFRRSSESFLREGCLNPLEATLGHYGRIFGLQAAGSNDKVRISAHRRRLSSVPLAGVHGWHLAELG